MSAFVKAGVLGYPVAHSKSPLIHNYWIKKYGLSGSYEAFEIPPHEFSKSKLLQLADQGFSGFNITLPHKEQALLYCDEIADHAAAIGAVNTICVRRDRLYGTNTDAFGFIQSLKEKSPGFDFKGRPALVLGAGGAAKAAIYGLLEQGTPKIIICNRTRARAEDLAAQALDKVRISVLAWEDRDRALQDVGLIVNTTSMGLHGTHNLYMDFSAADPRAAVYDMVYSPLATRFLEDARNAQLQTVSGIHMLLHQARPAFELWFGMLPEVDEALETLVTS